MSNQTAIRNARRSYFRAQAKLTALRAQAAAELAKFESGERIGYPVLAFAKITWARERYQLAGYRLVRFMAG